VQTQRIADERAAEAAAALAKQQAEDEAVAKLEQEEQQRVQEEAAAKERKKKEKKKEQKRRAKERKEAEAVAAVAEAEAAAAEALREPEPEPDTDPKQAYAETCENWASCYTDHYFEDADKTCIEGWTHEATLGFVYATLWTFWPLDNVSDELDMATLLCVYEAFTSDGTDGEDLLELTEKRLVKLLRKAAVKMKVLPLEEMAGKIEDRAAEIVAARADLRVGSDPGGEAEGPADTGSAVSPDTAAMEARLERSERLRVEAEQKTRQLEQEQVSTCRCVCFQEHH